MQALHFGAGSIGRGFIGDLLKESGYDLTLLILTSNLMNKCNSRGL